MSMLLFKLRRFHYNGRWHGRGCKHPSTDRHQTTKKGRLASHWLMRWVSSWVRRQPSASLYIRRSLHPTLKCCASPAVNVASLGPVSFVRVKRVGDAYDQHCSHERGVVKRLNNWCAMDL